jgi:C-terminal processing protease CtpA/Prc
LQEFEPAQYGIVDLRKLSKTFDSTPASLVSTSSNTSSSDSLAATTTTTTSSSSTEGNASRRRSRVGYLKVLTFSATAPQAVAEALLDIQKEAQQADGLAGLIVDLRDNPGGIVEAGVDIAQVRRP